MKLSVLILLALAIAQCNAAKILAFLPVPILSHHMVFRPIFKELADRGHDLTLVTMLTIEDAKYKQIIVTEDNLKKEHGSINFFELRKKHWIFEFIGLSYMSEVAGHATYRNPEVQKLIHSTDVHFDLILAESTFVQESFVMFGHKFNAPVIELQSICTSFWSNALMGNPNYFSYIVDYKTVSSNKMNFMERLHNTILGITSLIVYRYFMFPKQEKLADLYMNYTGYETRPSLLDQIATTSLVLVNTHEALHYAQPNNPNVIYVGGIHVKPPKKLPEDIQTYLDNAKQGVIYFSLGSNVKSSMMPEETKDAFISAFAKLPYKVLWKWETESLPNQPSNVKISKWLPQSDILSHPNVKAFITHGGLLSITESVHRGVPMVVIPIFADQPKNAIQAEAAGFGVYLDFDNVTEDSITWAVKEATKPIFKETALKYSAILRDNPLSPMETAIYWIEYVIRHKGAPHLLTAAINLTWYQYYLLDVIAVLFGGVVLVLVIVYLILRTIIRSFCGRKTETKPVKTLKKKN